MKSLDKNITSHDKITSFMVVQSMQGRMASAALTNGLSLTTTVGLDDKGIPYLGYAVKYHGDDRPIFHGQARLPNDTHYAFVMQMLVGAIVSEICPPAMRKTPTGEIVSYWKRNLTVEHDITVLEHSDGESKTDSLNKARRITSWIGYNQKGVEVIRVQEGTANEGYQEIERVQFLSMGARGTVAAVIFKDDNIPKEFEKQTLGDSIKETERQRLIMSQEQGSTATATMAVSEAASSGIAPIGDRFEDTGLTSVSPVRMSLKGIDKAEQDIVETMKADSNVEQLMYGGMRVVLPKVLSEEEFNVLNSEAKNQYLSHIDGIVKLTMHKEFELEKADPEVWNKFVDFLKRVLESSVFLNVWKRSYIARATQYYEMNTLPYYTARSLGMTDAMFFRILPNANKFLTLEELKILRPDLKNLGPRGENGVVKSPVDLPMVLTKVEYNELSPEGQRAYYDNIQKVVRHAAAIWFDSAAGQVSEEELKFLKDVLFSDLFSDGWENFIKKAVPDRRFSKTYYAAQALGFTDDFLQRLIGMFTKFEPEAEVAQEPAAKKAPARKAPAKKAVAVKAAAKTAAKKPAAKKTATTPVEGRTSRTSVKAATKK